MATMLDLVNAYTTDITVSAADTAAVARAEALQVADLATEATDTAALASALASVGPIAVLSADGTSVSIYAGAPASPGLTVVVYPTAANVPVPVPAA